MAWSNNRIIFSRPRKHPFPLSLDRFRKMCGSSDARATSWRQTVKKACVEIVEARIAVLCFLDKNDQIVI